MKYINNFNHWINPEWIKELLANTGTGRPAEGQRPDTPEMVEEYRKAREAGYKDNDIYFYMFDNKNVSFNIEPPFVTEKYHWWITKMLPGNFMPIHKDPHTMYQKNSKRYWMPLQDWEPGHIFLYEDQVITNYKAGDVWMYEEASAVHGAANIGYTPRLVLQVSTYE